jgi:protein MAK16
MQIDEVVW